MTIWGESREMELPLGTWTVRQADGTKYVDDRTYENVQPTIRHGALVLDGPDEIHVYGPGFWAAAGLTKP